MKRINDILSFSPLPPLSDMERMSIIRDEVKRRARQGWHLEATSPDSFLCSMTRKKRFSFLWAMFWLLMFGVGLIVYLIYYWSKKDEYIMISVSPTGKITVSKS